MVGADDEERGASPLKAFQRRALPTLETTTPRRHAAPVNGRRAQGPPLPRLNRPAAYRAAAVCTRGEPSSAVP